MHTKTMFAYGLVNHASQRARVRILRLEELLEHSLLGSDGFFVLGAGNANFGQVFGDFAGVGSLGQNEVDGLYFLPDVTPLQVPDFVSTGLKEG